MAVRWGGSGLGGAGRTMAGRGPARTRSTLLRTRAATRTHTLVRILQQVGAGQSAPWRHSGALVGRLVKAPQVSLFDP